MNKANKRSIPAKTVFILAITMMMVGFIAGTRQKEILAVLAPIVGSEYKADQINLSSVQNTYETLNNKFDGDLNKEKLIEGASKGLVEAAGDKYTEYMNKEESERFNNDLSGNVGAGIGAEIGLRNGVPTVVRPLKENPAIKSGLLAGDIITEVNGDSTGNSTVEEVTNKIKGEAGTTVKLKILRGEEVKEYSIARAKINNPSVELDVENETAVLTISRFDSETPALSRKYAKEILDKNIKNVILDLRGNGGGYVSAAQEVASLWLEKNDLIVVEKAGGKTTDELKASGNNTLKGKNTIVLIDGYSASASEIVVGALKDNKVAKILGEKTYGKGSVQQPIEINGGALLKVTVARWFTPSGRNITDEGIVPDSEVKITAEDINAGKDPQLSTAKELVRK